MTTNDACDRIARLLHDKSIGSMSSFQKAVAIFMSKTGNGRIVEDWNWNRTKRVRYFEYVGG